MLRSNTDLGSAPNIVPASLPFEQASGRCSEKQAPLTIVGSGNAALALSSYLAHQGYQVRLLVRSLAKVSSQLAQGRLTSTGKLTGEFRIDAVTELPESALAECGTIFIATVTTAYPEIARRIAPFVRSNQEIVLFSSKFGGVIEFTATLREMGAQELPILEMDALFASRVQVDGSVWVRGIKQWTLFSSNKRSQTKRYAQVIQRFFPKLEPADNVVQRGLTDFGALAHPLTMLANMNKVDGRIPFLFYQEGFTERTVVLMEQMEQEFRDVAHAYGTGLIPMPELLNRYYGCETSSLLAAMKSVPNYRVSQAPDTLNHRFIEEDVACSLVPIQQLARKAGLKTPLIDSVINLSSALLDVNFAERGRNLKRLGWDDLTHEQLVEEVNG